METSFQKKLPARAFCTLLFDTRRFRYLWYFLAFPWLSI